MSKKNVEIGELVQAGQPLMAIVQDREVWVVANYKETQLALMQPGQPWIAPECPGNVQDGVHSLLREVRQAFLRQNQMPVAGYSIVGATSIGETSSMLRPSWRRLSIHAKEQDGQIVAWLKA